jgi:hypothetical protein
MPSREGFDLFTKVGWENALRHRFDKWCRRYILEDTFMQLVCILVKYDIYDACDCDKTLDHTPEWACKRCHKYVKGRNYHILCRRILGEK